MNPYTLEDSRAPSSYLRWGAAWDWMRLPNENEERRQLQNVPLLWHPNAEQSGDEDTTRPTTVNVLPPCIYIPPPVHIYPKGAWWP